MIPWPAAMSRLNIPSVVTATVTLYVLPEPAKPVTLPVPMPSGDNTKSAASTPVTFSLKMIWKTRDVLFVTSTAGSLLVIDATVGAAVS